MGLGERDSSAEANAVPEFRTRLKFRLFGYSEKLNFFSYRSDTSSGWTRASKTEWLALIRDFGVRGGTGGKEWHDDIRKGH
jgi:hypothetical protein